MDTVHRVFVRDDDSESYFIPTQRSFVIAIFALLVLALLITGALFFLRRQRRLQLQTILPTHRRCNNHNRLATPLPDPNDSVHVTEEKRNLVANSSSPPPSSVPEIRITFPDNEDVAGKRHSGRVVLLRIGESGAVGMEPVEQEQLPAYQSSDSGKFHSLDLDRIGGLREKEQKHQ